MKMFCFDLENIGRIRRFGCDIWNVHCKAVRMVYDLLISGKKLVGARRSWPGKTTGATALASVNPRVYADCFPRVCLLGHMIGLYCFDIATHCFD